MAAMDQKYRLGTVVKSRKTFDIRTTAISKRWSVSCPYISLQEYFCSDNWPQLEVESQDVPELNAGGQTNPSNDHQHRSLVNISGHILLCLSYMNGESFDVDDISLKAMSNIGSTATWMVGRSHHRDVDNI